MAKPKKQRRRAAKGQGHIFLRGRIYWIKIHIPGIDKPHYESSADPKRGRDGTKHDHAAALLREQQGLIGRGEHPKQLELKQEPDGEKTKPEEVTVAQVLEAYRLSQEDEGRKSLDDVDFKIKRLMPFFGNRTVASLDAATIREYKKMRSEDVWQGRKTSKGTIRNELARLSAALHDAAEAEMIDHRHIPIIKLPPVSNARQGFIEVADLKRFKDAFPWSYRPYIIAKFWTGARSQELLGAKWSQVTWTNGDRQGYISLREGETKNNSGRMLMLVPEVEELLRERRRWLDDHGFHHFPYVFFRLGHRIDRASDDPKAEPRQLGEIREMWIKVATQCNLRVENGTLIRPHDLRRSLAKLLNEKAGISTEEIMDLMGWKTYSMFLRYNIHDWRRRERVGKKMSEISQEAA